MFTAMSNKQLSTPIVLIIFNRPDTTRRVFEAVRRARPEKLFIIADGARSDRPGEAEKCTEVRTIIEQVDWDCELHKEYSDINLGCKKRVSSGLNKAFKEVDRAIILEDDCLPNPSFFLFCEELLGRYQDDERIMSITGTNLLHEWESNRQSYHFSYYFNCWGWATWRRAWSLYDVEMKLWQVPVVQARVRDVIADDQQFFNRKRFLDDTYGGRIDSWAFPFFFACLRNSGLTVTPSLNLVKNIGHSPDASRTKNLRDPRANLPLFDMEFPLTHPNSIAVDRMMDYQRYKKFWDKRSLKNTIKRSIKRLSLYE